jgi:hypothetical protein
MEKPNWAVGGWAYRTVGPAQSRITSARSSLERGLAWGVIDSSPPVSLVDLARSVSAALRRSQGKCALSISHDHYIAVGGGLQNCIRDEQLAFSGDNWAYLHICPVNPKPHLGVLSDTEDAEVLLSINGRRYGVVHLHDLVHILADAAKSGVRNQVIIHQMLGFAPEDVFDLVEASGCEVPIVWAHDLFSACPSIHLLRNDAEFCGAPSVTSAVCGICSYGNERAAHVARFERLFERLNPVVLTPSTFMAELWGKANPNLKRRGVEAIAPAAIDFSAGHVAAPFDGDRPLRVGFLGRPDYHKGWHAFEELARWFCDDPRYAFTIFGESDPGIPGLAFERVSVGPKDRSAMVSAIARTGMDVVLNWSLCQESFSFTALEAAAGGAFVLARKDAGNVVPLLRSIHPRRSHAVSDLEELMAMFIEGKVLGLAADADRRIGSLKFGSGSHGVVVRSAGDE